VGRGGRSLSNAQEFVDRYADVEPLPGALAAGSEVRVAGRALPGARFRSISVGHAPLPAALTRDKAAEIVGYAVPAPDTIYWPPPYRSARPVRLAADGTFTATLPLGSKDGPGLYYIGVWVEEDGRDLLASLRTVVVH
jgi:hypothetical protein